MSFWWLYLRMCLYVSILNDICCYLFIACFDWKMGFFQQTVIRIYYILKSMYLTLFNLCIQKSSHFFNLYFSNSLSKSVLFNCSKRVNFACQLKLWPGSLKCWSASCVLVLYMSLHWLLNLMLNAVSDLLVHCCLHSVHFIK